MECNDHMLALRAYITLSSDNARSSIKQVFKGSCVYKVSLSHWSVVVCVATFGVKNLMIPLN